jgi:ribonuclease D
MSPPLPSPEEIALLEPFERLGLDRILLVRSEADAQQAAESLRAAPVWGFDTESRPTFEVGQASEGPHIIQLATLEHAYIFQLHDARCRAIAGELLAHHAIVKAGFGLRDDMRRITHKLGVQPSVVLDLDTVFRERGYRRQMGIKAAIAVLFEKRYLKSKRAATSNWAQRELSPAQLLYAANDAWAALRVYQALGLSPSPHPSRA